MSEKILVPALGESISEATVSKWLKSEGDSVDADEPLVELETDKVNLEVPSPVTGILTKIDSKDGSIVEVGALLGSVSENGTNSKKVEEMKKIEPLIVESNLAKLDTKKEKKEIEIFEENVNEEEPVDTPLVLTKEVKEDQKILKPNTNESLSPAVRKIVTENDIDIKSVKGSGKDGRVLKGDLINLMGVNPPPSERKIKHGQEERIKMTRLRQTIAKRLKQAQQNAALLTTFNEIDMTNIMEMRKDNQEDFQNRYGVKLGFMSFFVKACVVALKNFPAVNAEIEGEEIIYKNYYNIGVAVGTSEGLVVPVLKNAEHMSFPEIEKNIVSFGTKARDGNITISDMSDGTFTISNGGIYGSLMSSPILNPPQSGILGMHKIQKRPTAINDKIEIRPMMYLALSYDHRIIDGREAVSFLVKVKENIEDPQRILIGV